MAKAVVNGDLVRNQVLDEYVGVQKNERGGFGLYECIFVRYGIGPKDHDFMRRLEGLLARALAPCSR